MEQIKRVSDSDLAQQTQRILREVQRGYTAVIERQGEPEAAMIDIVDYRLMRAALRCYAENAISLSGNGLPDNVLRTVGSVQGRVDLVVAHYLMQSISLGRAAELLGIAAIDLRNRLNRLNIMSAVSSVDREDIRAEVDAALQWKP